MKKYLIASLALMMNMAYASDVIENPKKIELEFQPVAPQRKINLQQNDHQIIYSSVARNDSNNLINVRFQLKSGNNELFLQKDLLINVSDETSQVISEDILPEEVYQDSEIQKCKSTVTDFDEKFARQKSGVRAIMNKDKAGNIFIKGIISYHNLKDRPIDCKILFTEQYKFTTMFHMDNMQIMEWSRFVDSRQSFLSTSFNTEERGALDNYQLKNVIVKINQ